MLKMMEDICSIVTALEIPMKSLGEMAQFLCNYMKQVESLLRLIRRCRQGEFELYLAALEEQVKYYFAHDLYKYARLIPVHLAETNELKKSDPQTWNALKKGDFVVTKSSTPFTNLFVDQTLEQKIRELKVAEGIIGITQNEEALNRYLLIAPELTRLVNGFQRSYGVTHPPSESQEHYQLHGSMATRIFQNAGKVKEAILQHCQGNPFNTNMSLMNIVSNMDIPDEIKPDILMRDQKGMARFKEFFSCRMVKATADKSVWDPIEKMKLKVFSTYQKKTSCKIKEKLVKLREDRQLLARFLVIQQARPELGHNLGETIGNYEFSVIPKAFFSTDGQLLIPSDKSSFLKLIENYNTSCNLETLTRTRSQEPRERVYVIDAMVVVQAIKKGPNINTCADLAETFVQTISKLMQGYSEGRVIFDRYIHNSLKTQTRAKRTSGCDPVKFYISDSTNIKFVQLKTLLSHIETKAQLTKYLGDALLHAFAKRTQSLGVVYGTLTFGNKPDLFDRQITEHTHEEADTLIPLHVMDAAKKDGRVCDIDVFSTDTDVLVLLLDLASTHQLLILLQLTNSRESLIL